MSLWASESLNPLMSCPDRFLTNWSGVTSTWRRDSKRRSRRWVLKHAGKQTCSLRCHSSDATHTKRTTWHFVLVWSCRSSCWSISTDCVKFSLRRFFIGQDWLNSCCAAGGHFFSLNWALLKREKQMIEQIVPQLSVSKVLELSRGHNKNVPTGLNHSCGFFFFLFSFPSFFDLPVPL